jgi:ABC-2 type transport system permease protein
VAGGFLLYVLADSAGAPAWVAGMSPFAHLASVPNAAPNWVATTAFILIGVGLVAMGITGYVHRDLTT